ncbi:MAG: hypothetical protein LC808_00985 [Actinobacteria bacterium]|nr:hypothetical protein [Actinomycetota bacterium]
MGTTMWQTAGSVRVLRMPIEAKRQTLQLELEGTEPISGHVRDTDGVEHMFNGWLELIQILEHARLDHRNL